MAFSLLDTAGMRTAEWYCVFHPRTPFFFWAKWLKQGYRHVELCRPIQYGSGIDEVVWLECYPNFEMLSVDLNYDPRPPWVRCPESTVVKVTAMRKAPSMRSWWLCGPMSCVEIAKAALGIRAFWIRTPWQLYQYLSKRNGIVVS